MLYRPFSHIHQIYSKFNQILAKQKARLQGGGCRYAVTGELREDLRVIILERM